MNSKPRKRSLSSLESITVSWRKKNVVYWLANILWDNSLQGCLISVILSYLDRGHAEHSNDAHFNSIHAFPRKKKFLNFIYCG